jgi:hypothetical protein
VPCYGIHPLSTHGTSQCCRGRLFYLIACRRFGCSFRYFGEDLVFFIDFRRARNCWGRDGAWLGG